MIDKSSDEFLTLTSPEYFFLNHVQFGRQQPVVFRSAVERMVTNLDYWSDEYLHKTNEKTFLDLVETEKKETRT